MNGRENGLLKKIIQNLSHVICIHCVAHTVGNTLMILIQSWIIYKFYLYSWNRMWWLRHSSKFRYLQHAVWIFSSRDGELSSLLKEQQCVPSHLENVGASTAFEYLLKQISNSFTFSIFKWVRGQLKCDGTSAETRFRLSAKRTIPFKLAGGVSSVDYCQPRCVHRR